MAHPLGDGLPNYVLAGFCNTKFFLSKEVHEEVHFKASCHIWLCYLWGKFDPGASHSIANGLLSEPDKEQFLSSTF